MDTDDPALATSDPLLDGSVDPLLIRLADDVVEGAGLLAPERRLMLGYVWLKAQRDWLRELICKNPRIRALRQESATSLAELAAAIADLLAAFLHRAAAATVAMLLVTIGLERLCRGL